MVGLSFSHVFGTLIAAYGMTSKWALLRGLGDALFRLLLFRYDMPLSLTGVEFPIR